MMLTKDMRLPESEEDLPSTDLEQRVSMAERYSQLGIPNWESRLLEPSWLPLLEAYLQAILAVFFWMPAQSLANLPEQC